jgi:hypothetical protein
MKNDVEQGIIDGLKEAIEYERGRQMCPGDARCNFCDGPMPCDCPIPKDTSALDQ